MLRLLCLLAAVCGAPLAAQDLAIENIRSVIREASFDGDLVIASNASAAPRMSHLGLLPEPYRGGEDGLTWRWASVTKQIIAILVMQQVEAGKVDLDAPASRYLPDFASANADTVTIRQLLQHRSGLPNPDAQTESHPNAAPPFYRSDFQGNRDPVTGYCAGEVTGPPGGDWAYNNCDYMVLGAILEAVTGASWQQLFDQRIVKPLKLEYVGVYPDEEFTRWGFIGDEREAPRDLAAYGASAAIYGNPDDLMRINLALIDHELLKPETRALMWESDPALGYMALGQWVFPASLAGCDAPVRIVERRGAIGAVEVRNFILPDKKMAVVAFSQDAPFEFGEVWTGHGFSYDLLAAAACGATE